jgi:DNA/RNA endonuclease YhcR with UshA esterase domain
MLERAEVMAATILLTVLLVCAISAVILENAGKAPFASEYSREVPAGSLVHLQGIVQKVTPLQGGTYRLLQVNGVPVFLSKGAAKFPVKTGDHLSLYGVVQLYQGEREVVVSIPEDITVVDGSSGKNQHS